MKKVTSHIVPLIAILYCIAFFEVEIGGVQQTWGDEYDSYVTASHSSNIGTSDYINLEVDYTPTTIPPFYHFTALQLQVVGIAFENVETHHLAASRLFSRNCTWLI